MRVQSKVGRQPFKDKKLQSKCMLRVGNNDMENPYKIIPDIFDFSV